jgi:predicted nucleotidyltransferase
MQQQINDSFGLLKLILGQNLLGVYLYGSSVAGGLQKYSDSDLFVVTGRSITLDEKKNSSQDFLKSLAFT